MQSQRRYSAPLASCPASCPGKRSPWNAAIGNNCAACPLGFPFCGAWNAEQITVKVRLRRRGGKEIAA